MGSLRRVLLIFASTIILLGILGGSILIQVFLLNNPQESPSPSQDRDYALKFNQTSAWQDLVAQVRIGPRYPGTAEIEKCRSFIVNSVDHSYWQIFWHNFTYLGVLVLNILVLPINAFQYYDQIILLGAHYDTRIKADRDTIPANQNTPVTGANDGASGVVVLLELTRAFQARRVLNAGFLFIDAEDQGSEGMPNWGWIVGSTRFVQDLDQFFPKGKDSLKAFVSLDMVGDWQLNIHKEWTSDSKLMTEIWGVAQALNFTAFVDSYKFSMLDDHVPFANAGIPTVDIIDFDYYDENGNNLHHTVKDNLNYVSAKSLYYVGTTLEQWIYEIVSSKEAKTSP